MAEESEVTKVGGCIYMALPCYGRPHPAAAKQFWVNSMNPSGKRALWPRLQDDKGRRALCDVFNLHWCQALNAQKAGIPVTHFAMLHNDCVPSDYWLDTLMDAMEEIDADFMHALVAIKDLRGLTSTAIDDPDNDWEVLRRLTMQEIHNLPDVFTAADCGYPNQGMCPNTGCWVARFDRPWRYKVHFEFKHGIVFRLKDDTIVFPDDVPQLEKDNPEAFKDGCWGTRFLSEDWILGKQLAAAGAKVGATRRVVVRHIDDEIPYTNDVIWGSYSQDEDMKKKHGGQMIPPIKIDPNLGASDARTERLCATEAADYTAADRTAS